MNLVSIHLKVTAMANHIVQAENVASLSVVKWKNYLFLLCHMKKIKK